ncbi:MAG: J domain-containing protein [Desulfobulbaceae bacterium]|nr:J domain-containing protein [Desulfobulbaceae bacterium]
MKTPYQILRIKEDADDASVKKAYLAAVKQFPPERFPEQFQKVREAYEKIGTEKDRLRYALFDTSMPDPLEIAELLLQDGTKKRRLNEKQFRKLLADCLAEMPVLFPGNGES